MNSENALKKSPKTSEYRTSNIYLLLQITDCFIGTWTRIKKPKGNKHLVVLLLWGSLAALRAADLKGVLTR